MAQKQKDEEIIKTYKMVEGDYSVMVRILEANDLVPTNSGFSIFKSKGSACNAFFEVTLAGQSRKTKIVKGQLSPIFNQVLSFKLKDMKKAELQNTTINISAYDRKNAVLGNTIIGSYELDLSSIYFNLNHEFYRTYLSLSDPTDEREGCMGYVLVNVTVLGPDDEPFIHDVTTEKKADATKGQTLTPRKIHQWSHQIKINLLKGEHMVPLDVISPEIDAYVVMKYGGSKVKSKVNTSRNPEWYQQLNIGCMLPNQSKIVDISVYDRDLAGDDDLVGTFQLPFKDIPEQESAPIWLNLYGAPLKGNDKEADMMNLYGATMGSHYRGRVLMTMCRFDQRDSKTFKQDLQYKFPDNPIPISEQKSYVLRVDLLEGHELPIRDQTIIQIKMGPYLLVSKPGKQEDGSVMFYENLPDKKVLFPKSIQEVPDVIIYMADENIEDRRHSFIRIKASEILDQKIKPQVLKLREDRSLDLVSDDEFPGFLYANIQLMSTNPGIRKPYKPDAQNKIEYELRVFLYIGRNLPPADATGTSDPLVKIRCAGQLAQSKVCSQTLNPGWYETLKLNVKLYPLDQEQVVPAGMFVMVFDEDKQEDEDPTYDLIGRIWITLQPSLIKFQSNPTQEPIEVFYKKPKWYNIVYDATDEVQGQILLSYALIKKEDANKVPDEPLYPSCEKGKIHLFCIGLRNIDEVINSIEPTNCCVSFDISGDDYDPILTDYKKIKAKAININRLISIDIDIPRNQNFCPVLDCYVWNKEPGEKEKLLGISTIDLGRLLQSYYRKIKLPPGAIMEEEDEDDEEDQELMALLDKPKAKSGLTKLKTNAANNGDEEEENQEIDLDKIDLTVPWELPMKKKIVDQEQYEIMIKQKQQEKEKLKQIESNIEQESHLSKQLRDLPEDLEDKPIYRPTTYNQTSNIIPIAQNQLIGQPQSQQQQQQPNQQQPESFIIESKIEVQVEEQQQPLVNVQCPIPDEDEEYIQEQDENQQLLQQSQQQESPQQFQQQQQQQVQQSQSRKQSKGQIEADLRNLGSQRSIRQLSQVDQEVVLNPEKHYKNAEESRRMSQENMKMSLSQKPQEVNKSQHSIKSQLQQLPQQNQILKSFKVPTDLSFSKASKVSSHALSINDNMKDNMDAKQKSPKKKGKKKKDMKKAKLFSFMAFMPQKKKVVDKETYEDYDTDPGEDLDITPPWLKGRKFLKDDLEDFMKPSKKFMKMRIKSGQSRGQDSKFLAEKSVPQEICDFKFIFLEEKKGEDMEKKKEMYQKMMKPKKYNCRLYILQGVDIQSNDEEPPDLYLKIKTADQYFDLKKSSLRTCTNNPQFYFPYEIAMEVPGSCILEIEIWSVSTISDEKLGSTLIDLEDRYFAVTWHKFETKPIENRNLKDEFGSSIGRLQMWIDLIERAQSKSNPLIKITAPPRYEFELRTVIYETKNCAFKDELEKCNDLYCKGGIANQELQETDVHWRCRAKGSFNWRVKNKVFYPPLPDDFGTDKFKLQLWDKDLVGSDELIGETTFSLNTHKMIDKAVKRLQTVQVTQRIREKGGQITDRFWLDVYHPDAVDEEGQKISQGQALVSFELMPLQEAEKKPNGLGRDAPNAFPPLSEPTGRLSFDIANPLQFFKDIMGPDLYNKICKFLLSIVILTAGVAVGWIFLGPLIANVVV